MGLPTTISEAQLEKKSLERKSETDIKKEAAQKYDRGSPEYWGEVTRLRRAAAHQQEVSSERRKELSFFIRTGGKDLATEEKRAKEGYSFSPLIGAKTTEEVARAKKVMKLREKSARQEVRSDRARVVKQRVFKERTGETLTSAEEQANIEHSQFVKTHDFPKATPIQPSEVGRQLSEVVVAKEFGERTKFLNDTLKQKLEQQTKILGRGLTRPEQAIITLGRQKVLVNLTPPPSQLLKGDYLFSPYTGLEKVTAINLKQNEVPSGGSVSYPEVMEFKDFSTAQRGRVVWERAKSITRLKEYKIEGWLDKKFIPERRLRRLRDIAKLQRVTGQPLQAVGTELLEGGMRGVKERPIKTGVTTLSFIAVPPILKALRPVKKLFKGIGKIPTIQTYVISKVPTIIKYGLPTAWAGVTTIDVATTPKGFRTQRTGELIGTEAAPMIVGSWIGTRGGEALTKNVKVVRENFRYLWHDVAKRKSFGKVERVPFNIETAGRIPVIDLKTGAVGRKVQTQLIPKKVSYDLLTQFPISPSITTKKVPLYDTRMIQRLDLQKQTLITESGKQTTTFFSGQQRVRDMLSQIPKTTTKPIKQLTLLPEEFVLRWPGSAKRGGFIYLDQSSYFSYTKPRSLRRMFSSKKGSFSGGGQISRTGFEGTSRYGSIGGDIYESSPKIRMGEKFKIEMIDIPKVKQIKVPKIAVPLGLTKNKPKIINVLKPRLELETFELYETKPIRMPKIRQDQRVRVKQRVVQEQRLRMVPLYNRPLPQYEPWEPPPPPPPPPPPTIIPVGWVTLTGKIPKTKKRKSKTKRKYKYLPSLAAGEYNIKTRFKPKIMTGLRVRPILI